jgi:hypothetical protein
MDINYLKALNILEDTKTNLEAIFDNSPTSTFEDEEASYRLQYIMEKLETTEKTLEYLNSPYNEGILQKNNLTGNLFIKCNGYAKNCQLNCGNLLEIFYKNKWYVGKIFLSINGNKSNYYLYGDKKLFLYPGMLARKRF